MGIFLGRTLLVIQVPSGSQVCRHHGRIFDRGHEADIDITDHSDMVYQLYARKSVSARDRILREICSNSLARRDFSSGYVAKFVIERDRLYTENANRSHGHGALHLSSFEPYAKNPPISKVFREIGLADELGSGMRNTYKYTKLYSGRTPEFIEGDVFRTVIPLTPVAVEKIGPQDGTQVRPQVETQVRTQVLITDQILTFCAEPRSKAEIAEHCGYKNTKSFTKRYMRPLLDNGQLQMTIPDKPRSQHQKYVTAQNSQ